MVLRMGAREMELGGPYLGDLRDATSSADDPAALRERMAEDGYLLIRGMHDPERVRAARRAVLESLKTNGQLDESRPLDEAGIPQGGCGAFFGGAKTVTHTPEFLGLVESPELMRFFSDFLGGAAMTFSYKWLRAIGHEGFTGAHYDIVYMGRGTTDLFTCWTPIGDVRYEQGPLAVIEGSHKLDRLKETCGRMDVDRDNVSKGFFSEDPIELVDLFGGRFLTAEFEVGDALIFGMYTMHGSLLNETDCYRISCDTRYQRADQPADERWIGEKPIAHYAWGKGETIRIEEARRKWGV